MFDNYYVNYLSPRDVLKHHYTSLQNRLNFPTTTVLEGKFPWQFFYQYMAIFFHF